MSGLAKTGILLRTATGGLALAIASGAAAETALGPAAMQTQTAKVELIDSSRLGCGQSMPLFATGGGTQCAFDSATRGARVTTSQETGFGSLESYAIIARTVTGAFTPDQLLVAPTVRSSQATSFFMAGFKGSALDNRLRLTAEFASTAQVVDQLRSSDWALADSTRKSGSLAQVRMDATLIDRPGLKWSLAGDYRAVSDDYSVGRSSDLMRYFAMPGTRLVLSSRARVGALGLNAGVEASRTPFGTSSMRKAGLDFQGIALNVRSRSANASPIEGSALLDSRTRTDAVYLDIDSATLAGWLFPDVATLPFMVPSSISLAYRSGETKNRFQASSEHYGRTSLGIDASWETPLGETGLSYWRDTRAAMSEGARSWASETVQVDHSIRRGNWRFGLDAAMTRTRGDGGPAYGESSLSFGQSIAYSAPNGPEFRLQLGQDRGSTRMADDSYASSDSYSSITASLDLSRYLQARFERPDLRLTLDYRKALDRTESEMSLYDQLVERWDDTYRREGLLLSFGMVL